MLPSCRRAKAYPAAVAAAHLHPRPSRFICLPIASSNAKMRKLKLPIPVSIITGALGVGKTTCICSLLQHKPPTEVWCIIVNEFGAVGIDAIAIQASCAEGSAVVKQVAGGCMCCVLSGPLSAAIAQIIRQVKPDRVIIEPSGLGHPGGLIDILQGPHLSTSLQLNSVICLVDLANFDPSALMANETAAAQVTVADVLVGNKADAAATGVAEAFKQWAAEYLFPPKQEVLITQQGHLDSFWLDASRQTAAARLLMKPNSQSSRAKQQMLRTTPAAGRAASAHKVQPPQEQQPKIGPADAASSTVEVTGSAKPGQPLRVPGLGLQAGPHCSCGWVFDQQDVFDQDLLLQLLQELQPYAARVKGVFRVAQKQWVMPAQASEPQQQQSQQPQDSTGARQDPKQSQQGLSIVNGVPGSKQLSLQLQPTCYRGASMVEVIIATGPAHEEYAPGCAVSEAIPVQALLQGSLLRFVCDETPGHTSSTHSQFRNTKEGPAAAAVADAAARLAEISTDEVDNQVNSLQKTWDLLEKAMVRCLQQ